MNIIEKIWARFCILFAGPGRFGRTPTWFATWTVPPYTGRNYISWYSRKGYISPRAQIHHSKISFGNHLFIDDRALIFEMQDSGPVQLGDWVQVHSDVIIQKRSGGSVTVGRDGLFQHR